RVAVLTTGTELRRPGEQLAAGEIYESNGPMLQALLASAGAAVELLDSVEDDEAAHRAAIEQGLGPDMLVSPGGASVRPDELVRARLTLAGELEPLSGQESHMIVRAAEANALVFVPTGAEELGAGSIVRFLPL